MRSRLGSTRREAESRCLRFTAVGRRAVDILNQWVLFGPPSLENIISSIPLLFLDVWMLVPYPHHPKLCELIVKAIAAFTVSNRACVGTSSVTITGITPTGTSLLAYPLRIPRHRPSPVLKPHRRRSERSWAAGRLSRPVLVRSFVN